MYGRDDNPAPRRSGARDDLGPSAASSSHDSPSRSDRRRRHSGGRTRQSLTNSQFRGSFLSRRSERTLRAQIEELAALEGLADSETPPPTHAATPLEILPRAIDPMLGQGSGTVSTAICADDTALEPIPAGILSGCASHEPEIAPGRKVRNPHRPHVIRLPEQVRRSAGHVPASLRPARDTGLSCVSRADRMRERQRRRQQALGIIAVLVIAAVITAGLYWKSYSDEQAAQLDLTAAAPLGTAGSIGATGVSAALAAEGVGGGEIVSLEASDTPTGTGAHDVVVEVTKTGVTPLTPTPVMATVGKLDIFLPVTVDDLTEVGFHQANYSYAVQMQTHMPATSVSDVNGKKGTERDKALQKYGVGSKLVGSYIQLWRSGRSAKPRTAADCGAKPGSPVLAPVTGTVSKVTTYKLEGKATDYEVHIVPDGTPNLEVVVIHISDVVVREGDHVRGGASPIARVRDISGIVRSQLASYANYQGNHTHIQVNDTDCAAYLAKHKGD